MGTTQSTTSSAQHHDDLEQKERISFTLEDEATTDMTDHTFPWLPVIECIADTLECGVVRTYNLKEAKIIILSASRYPLIVPDCILSTDTATNGTKASNTVLRWSSMDGPWSKSRAHQTPQLSSLLYFAGNLLKTDSNLSKLRFSAVPSRMSETMFWCLYFDRISILLRRRLLGPERSTLVSSLTAAMPATTTTTTAAAAISTKPTTSIKNKNHHHHKRKRIACQWKYGLNGRWERLISIRDSVVRSVGYALCSIPLWLMTTSVSSKPSPSTTDNTTNTTAAASATNLSTEWWTSDVYMDEMLEWIMSIDRSKQATNDLRRFMLSYSDVTTKQSMNGTMKDTMKDTIKDRNFDLNLNAATNGQQSWMTVCHLYMLSSCPLFHASRLNQATTPTVVPLMGEETLHVSKTCVPIVLQSTGGHDSSTTTAAHTNIANNHKSNSPQVLRRNTPIKIMPPTPEELKNVSELIRNQRTTELLNYAIVQGRISSVNEILLEQESIGKLNHVLKISSFDSSNSSNSSASSSATTALPKIDNIGSPLHVAVLECQLDCVRALLKAGAQVNAYMLDQIGHQYNVLEIAKDNELMSQCLEMWYMQGVYNGRLDIVLDYCLAGRKVTEPMLDGTIPILMNHPLPSMEVYVCLWKYCQDESGVESDKKGNGDNEITDIATHQQNVVVPWLKAKEIQKAMLPIPKINIKLRDIKCTMVFITNKSKKNNNHSSSTVSTISTSEGTEGTNEVKGYPSSSTVSASAESSSTVSSSSNHTKATYFVERTSHIDISTIDYTASCINGATILSLSIRDMRQYCHQQKELQNKETISKTLKWYLEEYNMYVHGWVYYELPLLNDRVTSTGTTGTSATAATAATAATSQQTPTDQRSIHGNQVVPNSMTACWSGWYVTSPLNQSMLNSIQKYLVGPLYYLTNIFDAFTEDIGPRCTPYRFEGKDIDALSKNSTISSSDIDVPEQIINKKHGNFFNNNSFIQGIQNKSNALDQLNEKEQIHNTNHVTGNTTTVLPTSKWIFMIIELRYNKMLGAWIEASRGAVR